MSDSVCSNIENCSCMNALGAIASDFEWLI